MTPKEQAAMQQALEALKDYHKADDDRVSVAMSILQEALSEQAEQEPVAWVDPTEEQIMAQTGYVDMNHDDLIDFYLVVKLCKQLNSASVRTKDMTDDEINKISITISNAIPANMTVEDWKRSFARAVIAADREKNR